MTFSIPPDFQLTESESRLFEQAVRSQPELLTPRYVIAEYQKFARHVIPNPADVCVIRLLSDALQKKRPFSVVRIGDGEINLLTARHYKQTPVLNRHARRQILTMQQDRFAADDAWFELIADLLYGSLLAADVVGVIGLWRPRFPTPEGVISRFRDDPRGVSGQWRAVDYMLHLARRGFFMDKVVASAHLYLSVVQSVDALITQVDRVVVLSNRYSVCEQLAERHSDTEFLFIEVGREFDSQSGPRVVPGFLYGVYRALPEDLSGMLCLVGAGPWAEIYCSWIKGRGGIAIDVGSGLDLMSGKMTRPVHQQLLKVHE